MRPISCARFRELAPNAHSNPALHAELGWYATDDEQLFGVVILDLVDHDYSWVLLSRDDKPVELNISIRTEREACEQLFGCASDGSAETRCDRC
jgi:hypothetical protein